MGGLGQIMEESLRWRKAISGRSKDKREYFAEIHDLYKDNCEMCVTNLNFGGQEVCSCAQEIYVVNRGDYNHHLHCQDCSYQHIKEGIEMVVEDMLNDNDT